MNEASTNNNNNAPENEGKVDDSSIPENAIENETENSAESFNLARESKKHIWKLFLIPVFGFVFVFGYLTAKLFAPANPNKGATSTATSSAKKTKWTCSMHPQFKLPKKGKCPICFMDLIPLKEGSGGKETVLEMSKDAIKLAEIRTSKVERRIAEAELRFVGKVDYDETRMKTITSWMSGRLDRLYVDYTGVAVKKGDHLVYLYSPDLISAQEELLQAIRAVEELSGSSNSLIKSTAQDTVKAAREKLRLLGVTAIQLAKLEKSKKVEDHLTIYAPTGGIVVHKNAMEGMYVKTGSPIYRIADLSYVWIYLEAYESDLAWLRYGQTVEFETEAYPGEPFEGRISFIDPVLDTRTRTVKVRVNTPNADGRLKPGMFVRAKVKARMAKGGKILDNSLAGKWISPMHPEVVKETPGDCDVCGMPLVRAESLGLADSKQETEAPLLIPASSVLLTGTRAVVYIKKKKVKKPSFEGRLVTLGPRVGAFYIVKSGVKEGEDIVSHGAFKIDSALQIQAKTSMMSVDLKEDSHEGHDHEKKVAIIKISEGLKAPLRSDLSQVIAAYLTIQEALAADQETQVAKEAKALLSAISQLSQNKSAPRKWKDLVDDLRVSGTKLKKSEDIKDQRAAFSSFTQSLIVAMKSVGTSKKVNEVSCSMAFGGLGGTWLQKPGDIANPYFGASMLRCGEVKKSYEFAKGAAKSKTEDVAALDLDHVVEHYVELQEALAADDPKGAKKAAEQLKKHLSGNSSLYKASEGIANNEDIKTQRLKFYDLTKAFLPVVLKNAPKKLSHARCSMAMDGKGGDWLQKPGELANPYFGASMLRCGEVVASLKPMSAEKKGSKKSNRSTSLGEFMSIYIALQEAFAADNPREAKTQISKLSTWIESRSEWIKNNPNNAPFKPLLEPTNALVAAKEFKNQRLLFFPLTQALLPFFKENPPPMDLIHAYCSMARGGKGGDWLQKPGKLANPYYGATMLRCGEVKAEFKGGK